VSAPLAIVVGGSVGGLFAANLLRLAGWKVRVFERARGDLSDRGAGIGTKSDLFAVLGRIGIERDPSMEFTVHTRQVLGRDGSVLCEIERRQVNSAWDRIYRPLKQALPPDCYHGGKALERVEQSGSSVTAIFADGARAEGDLLIAADGVHSSVRSQFLPGVAPRYSGYTSWRGVLDERELEPEVTAALFHHMTFFLPPGELMLSLPMPGKDASSRRCHFVWFRPADEATTLRELCTDASGRCHGSSIAPALIRPEVLAALRRDAAERLAPQMAQLVERVKLPLLHAIHDVESPSLVFGRVALMGDAAFVARPHVGTGVTKAALDAQSLVDALSSHADIDAALRSYDEERRAFGSALVQRARTLGSHLETRPKSADEAKLAAFHRRPEVVLAEYGAEGRMLSTQER
jgi:2-polyprenyl-6-methoxyphenol hydroxylase-like FAD-dependent oxidoreductase